MSTLRPRTRTAALPSEERPYDDPRNKPRSKLIRYLESFAWIAGALGTGWWSDLPSALQNYGYGIPFYLLFVSLSGWTFVFLYLQFYIPFKTGTRPDLTQWETQAKHPVQIATAFGVISAISSCWMLWPAYGFLTPLLVFLMFMGGVSLIGLF
ncbi:hypothetical protein SpCBS45565_g05559 [Spizellomyces sp. 'palustris']|nr:hypothetical protein SpCBS45565_g05559 [Spizellomyces sp. 'palustris']